MTWDSFLQAVLAFDWSGLLKTLGTLAASAFAVFKFGARQSSLREHIKGDLELIDELNKNSLLRDHTEASAWLSGKILLDVAKLSGAPIGAKKKPIPWGTVVFATLVVVVFGLWTLDLNQNGFNWWSIATGAVTGLFLISILGMTTNRAISPDQDLPPGAVPLQSGTASEQVAGRVAALSVNASSPQFGATGVATAALEVFEKLQGGFFEHALDEMDPLWLECRLRSWLWGGQVELGLQGVAELDAKLAAILKDRVSDPHWSNFVQSESQQFQDTWRAFGLMGAGSARRSLLPGMEVVILAPIGNTGGYYVPTAAMVPQSLTFLMSLNGSKWRLVNHVGMAPPLPQWGSSYLSVG
ncbi:hypothetical protein [Tessaracoccus sp. Y1736]